LELSGNKLTTVDDVIFNENLKVLNLIGNEIKSIDGLNLPSNLDSLYLGADRPFYTAQSSFPAALRKLSLRLCEIDNASLKDLKLPENLEILDLSDNQISGNLEDLELPQSLKKLNLKTNILDNIDALRLPAKLRLLNLKDNFINSQTRKKILRKYRGRKNLRIKF
jgi:Leucine-rich repeat (LRR) protein